MTWSSKATCTQQPNAARPCNCMTLVGVLVTCLCVFVCVRVCLSVCLSVCVCVYSVLYVCIICMHAHDRDSCKIVQRQEFCVFGLYVLVYMCMRVLMYLYLSLYI